MLGGKGRSLIMMGVFLLTAGFSFTNYYLILSALFMIFATFVSLPGFDSSLNIEELKVKRVLASNKIFEDDFLHVKVVIENTGGTKFDFIDIFDEFPTDAFRILVGENFISTRIDPHKTIKFSYLLQPKIRGQYCLGPIDITVRDRLGFNAEKRIIPNSIDDLVIYPPYEDIRRLELMGAKRVVNKNFGVHKTKQIGSGTDFRSLR